MKPPKRAKKGPAALDQDTFVTNTDKSDKNKKDKSKNDTSQQSTTEEEINCNP